jgi:hypothetical protein
MCDVSSPVVLILGRSQGSSYRTSSAASSSDEMGPPARPSSSKNGTQPSPKKNGKVQLFDRAGRALLRLLRAEKWTDTQLARELGCSPHTITRALDQYSVSDDPADGMRRTVATSVSRLTGTDISADFELVSEAQRRKYSLNVRSVRVCRVLLTLTNSLLSTPRLRPKKKCPVKTVGSQDYLGSSERCAASCTEADTQSPRSSSTLIVARVLYSPRSPMVTFKLIISRVVSILVDAYSNANANIDDEHISEEDKRCYGREVCCSELVCDQADRR